MREIWKDVKGYEGLYKVSNTGKVKSFHNKRGGKETILSGGRPYLHINLCKGGNCKGATINRLVGIAFIPNPENKPEINHKDNNPLNNNVENLEWCTRKENMQHSVKQGRMAKGVDSGRSKLTEEQILEIKKLYVPYSRKFSTYCLGKKFGVYPHTILDVVRGKTWKHIGNIYKNRGYI